MGFFTAPTKEEIQEALGPSLDPTGVRAYVIGQGFGGRAAAVATHEAVYLITVAMFRLKPGRLIGRYDFAPGLVRRSNLSLTVAEHKLKLGMADAGRADELVNVAGAPPG